MGRKMGSSGEAGDGRREERRTHATLHGAHLLGKPGLLLPPPPECRSARSQSGSSSIFATTAHKLVPKLLMENETGRKMSSVAVWEYILSSRFPLIDGVRMHFNKTVKQIQGETWGEQRRCVVQASGAGQRWNINRPHTQTNTETHAWVPPKKQPTATGPDLSFSKITTTAEGIMEGGLKWLSFQ